MRNVAQRFKSVEAVRSAMWHEFANAVPDEGEFNVGFFEGSNIQKMAGYKPGFGSYVQSLYWEAVH